MKFHKFFTVNLYVIAVFNLICIISEAQGINVLDTSECGRTKGCWFTPVGCETDDSSATKCNEILKWSNPTPDTILIEMQGNTLDLNPYMGHYMSVGFSYDDKMGHDSVVACVAKPSGQITVYMGYDDETIYETLPNATTEMLRGQSGSVINGKIVCQVTRYLAPTAKVSPKEKWKVFDLADGTYTLMFARGISVPKSDKMIIHFMDDGDLFPWTATQKARMKIDGTPDWIKTAKHYDIPRSIQYKMTAAHGILMLFGWWVFGAAAMLLGRYFKPLWPNKTMLGTKVWYQTHRDLFVFSLILQVAGFILVFVQAGDLKKCSHACPYKDYALYLHTVLGIACTAAAVIQPFLAWFRPAQDSSKYKIFVWVHWLLGVGSWVLATVTMFLSPPLGKTGLQRNSGYKSDYLMAAYICSYILVSLVLEFLVQVSERPRRKIAGKSEMPNETLAGPVKEAGTPIGKPITREPRFGAFRLMALVLFVVVATGICVGITVLIVQSLGH